MPEVVDEFPAGKTHKLDLNEYKEFMDGRVWMFTPNDGRELGIKHHDERRYKPKDYKYTERDILETLRSRLGKATYKLYGMHQYRTKRISTEAVSEETLSGMRPVFETTYRLYYQFTGDVADESGNQYLGPIAESLLHGDDILWGDENGD